MLKIYKLWRDAPDLMTELWGFLGEEPKSIEEFEALVEVEEAERTQEPRHDLPKWETKGEQKAASGQSAPDVVPFDDSDDTQPRPRRQRNSGTKKYYRAGLVRLLPDESDPHSSDVLSDGSDPRGVRQRPPNTAASSTEFESGMPSIPPFLRDADSSSTLLRC